MKIKKAIARLTEDQRNECEKISGLVIRSLNRCDLYGAKMFTMQLMGYLKSLLNAGRINRDEYLILYSHYKN